MDLRNHVVLQSRIVAFVGLVASFLGVTLCVWRMNLWFQSFLVVLSGILGMMAGTSGMISKLDDKNTTPSDPVSIFVATFMMGEHFVSMWLLFIVSSQIACGFSVYTFQTTNLSTTEDPIMYILLMCTAVVTLVLVVGSVILFATVIEKYVRHFRECELAKSQISEELQT